MVRFAIADELTLPDRNFPPPSFVVPLQFIPKSFNNIIAVSFNVTLVLSPIINTFNGCLYLNTSERVRI